MGFQTQVNLQPAPAVAGDFASANPRVTVLAGPGGLVAGSNIPSGLTIGGVLVGRFAWAAPGTSINQSSGEIDGMLTVNSNGSGAPTGFVHREQQGLITVFLQEATQLIPQGLPVVLHNEGDFWAVNAGSAASYVGEPIYAINATGAVVPSASVPADATLTTITVVANDLNVSAIAPNVFVAGISGTTMTVASVTTGGLYAGQTLTGTNVAAGTTVVRQLTGATPGGTGTYQVNISQTVATGTTITGSGSWLTVTSMTNGVILVGMVISGGGVTAATVLAGGSGTGGAGTYPLSVAQTVADASGATGNGAYMNVTAVTGTIHVGDTITTGAHTGVVLAQVSGTTGGIGAYWISNAAAVGDVSGSVAAGTLTKWVAMSVAAPGELMKISSWPLG